MEGAHGVTLDPGIQVAEIHLLHEFAYCRFDNQTYRTALDYAWTWDTCLTETVSVPGHVGETFLRSRDDTLVVLRRMFHCLWLVHLSRLTMRGQFRAENFLISPRLSVRLRGVHLSRYATHLEGDADYQAFVESIRDMFVLEAVPADINRWLQLISRGVRGDGGYLPRYYVALMEPQQQLHTFFRSRRLLENNPGLQHIMGWFHRYNDWDLVPRVNQFLHQTQSYVNQYGVAAFYPPNIRGVWKLIRDHWEHPPVLMDEGQCIAVAQDDFPQLLCDVHEAMSRAGLLEQLKLEAIMT